MRSIPGTITEHPALAAAREATEAERAEQDLRNAQIAMNVAQRNYMEARDRVRVARQRVEAVTR